LGSFWGYFVFRLGVFSKKTLGTDENADSMYPLRWGYFDRRPEKEGAFC
jgi:hypothetical protein